MSPLSRIQVHPDGRFLMTADGKPFFWLADTAWELFHRLTREEARRFLLNRAQKSFTVIQAVVLAEFDGLRTPTPDGLLPLDDCDPTRPNEAYFAHVDEVIRMAADFNLYIGLLPTWGDKVTPMWGAGPVVFDEENARIYGEFLGRRYAEDTNVIWILGGDRPPVHEGQDWRPLWRAMAAGIKEGAGGQPLITYHPPGGLQRSTSVDLHNEDWLHFNMIQSGHGSGHNTPIWEAIARDYALSPAKPTLDAEPNYEDHPVNPWPNWDPANGYYLDDDVRRQSYRSVFAGGCGVTYGHHSIWQFCSTRTTPVNHPNRYWWEAMDRPGAAQMVHLRRLMESRPYFSRIPDDSLIVSANGASGEHLSATRDRDGRYAFVYFPDAVREAVIDLSKISGRVKAWWYDTHTGISQEIGDFPNSGEERFTTPLEWHDWVLVLDDASAGFGKPGDR
ncbi:MAG: glycoside hydrolase family 140 protein [Caldilineaceae bacterium]|nr:glycoside hydrolase family 140 protein [Caldilineaceae bacterium]